MQKNRGDKSHRVIIALGPVMISLLFISCSHGNDEAHYVSTNIQIRKPKWIDLKTQRYENGTICKRIRVTGALVGGKFVMRTSSII